VETAHFLGGITKWSIWVFTLLVALAELGIADFFAQTLFSGVVLAFAIAIGLSFGLGAQGTAGAWVEKLRRDISNH
jgi:hypothetical protein